MHIVGAHAHLFQRGQSVAGTVSYEYVAGTMTF